MRQTKIAFRECGEGPILIMLHGYAGSVLHWDPIVEKLKDSHKVVIPNLSHLFMGKENFTFSEQVTMFAEFIKENYPGQKIHLAGISYGAALVWGVALKYPQLVDRTIFINPMPPAPASRFHIQILKFFFFLPLNVQMIYLIMRTPVGRFVLKRATEVFRHERAELWERVKDLNGRKLMFVCHVIDNFAYILRNENWHHWEMRLESWTHPSILMFDPHDPLFEPRTYHDFQELIGCDLCFEIPDAGHIAIQTKPEEISKMIEDFLDVERGSTAA